MKSITTTIAVLAVLPFFASCGEETTPSKARERAEVTLDTLQEAQKALKEQQDLMEKQLQKAQKEARSSLRAAEEIETLQYVQEAELEYARAAIHEARAERAKMEGKGASAEAITTQDLTIKLYEERVEELEDALKPKKAWYKRVF